MQGLGAAFSASVTNTVNCKPNNSSQFTNSIVEHKWAEAQDSSDQCLSFEPSNAKPMQTKANIDCLKEFNIMQLRR